MAIINGFEYLTHKTNLTEYELIAQETSNITEKLLDSGGKTALKFDSQEILHLISTLRVHHRHARSINILGTALKYVAGTPDFEDFNHVKSIQERLLENNERQLLINSELQQKINNVTDILNKMIDLQKKLPTDNKEFLELVMHRNRIIITELNNVIYAVTLAKLNIVNPALLNNDEIQSIIFKEKFENISVSDVVNEANIKAMQDQDSIYFLIRYPRISKICTKLNIFPVVHNEIVVNLETDTVAKCGSQIEPMQKCRKSTFAFFCETFRGSRCVTSLFSNMTATCGTTSAFHIPPVQVLDEGVIILNNIFAQIRGDNGPIIEINGTYVIFFENFVNINGSDYLNHKKNSYMSPEAPMSQKVNFSNHLALLSLPSLNHANAKNLEHIMNLKQDVHSQNILTFVLFALAIFFCLSTSILWFTKYRQIKASNASSVQAHIEQAIQMLDRAADSSA